MAEAALLARGPWAPDSVEVRWHQAAYEPSSRLAAAADARVAALKASSPLIGQACVIGDARPYNVALLVLDPDASAAFAEREGLDDGALGAVSSTEAMIKAVADGVAKANERLSRVEQIKKFKLLDEDWEPGGDELTPTMKLKRKPIAEKYREEIEALYLD